MFVLPQDGQIFQNMLEFKINTDSKFYWLFDGLF
jgi:hypothetical protein